MPMKLSTKAMSSVARSNALRRDPRGWRETVVTATDRLAYARTPPAPVAALDHRLRDTIPGEIVEITPKTLLQAEDSILLLGAQEAVKKLIDDGER